jgi:lipopolysaccharide transport system ATP-binding protein
VGDHLATLIEAHVEDGNGHSTGEIDIRAALKVKMCYELRQRVPLAPYPNFHFNDTRGECAFVSSGRQFVDCNGNEPGTYVAECVVPGHLLNNGTYFVGLALTFTHQGLHVSFFEKDALSVTIVDPIDETLDDTRCGYSGPMPGAVRPKLDWVIRKHL